VTNAVISNNTAVASSDGSTSAGILVTTYFGPGTFATITDSVFSDNTVGVNVGYDAADTSTVVASNNCLLNNGTGVVSTAPAVNAENNWWNDANGPTIGGYNGVDSALIDYDPWLTSPPPACAVPVPVFEPSAEDHARAQAPLCVDLDGSTNPIVRADVPDGTVTNGGVFCRVLAENGDYVHGPAEVGNLDVINMGVIQAVDVFGMSGSLSVPHFNSSIKVCLQGSGRFMYLDATTAPRALSQLAAWSEGDYTCATLFNAGTVVLVQ
jgi:hypothetical protein